MNKKVESLKQMEAVLVLFEAGTLSKRLAAFLMRRIFVTDADASSGVSPDNSKNDGTGCTLVFA